MRFNEQIKNLDKINHSDKKNFWLKAFIIYAIAEALLLVIFYQLAHDKCSECVASRVYYVMFYLLNLALAVLMAYVLERFTGKGLWVQLIVNSIVFLFSYFCITGFSYTWGNAGREWLVTSTAEPSYRQVIYTSWAEIGKYVLKLSAFYMLSFYHQFKTAAQQRMQLAIVNKEMQLNLLKQQLSPHFYFNTLNNLYGLARSNNKSLCPALSQLANIMQYVLVDCNNASVLLEQEIEFLYSYMELEKLRYEKNTVIDLNVQGKVNGQRILPMMLIQFVENAFKHGMKEKSDNNWMKVNMQVQDKELLFTVENSLYDAADSGGIGIASVKNILNLQYSGKHCMQIQHEQNRYSVNLKLNLV